MGKPAAVVTLLVLLTLLGCGNPPAPPDPPAADYQQVADRAEWSWAPKQASLLLCVRQHLRDYQVEIVCPKEDRFGFEDEPLTVRLTDGGKEVYSFQAHDETVFMRRGDVLYIARFDPIASGCTVVDHDFKAKKDLWRAKLKGIGPVDHSKYRNEVTIETAGEDAVVVKGNEDAGRYIEYLDAKSGMAVGHKVFE